MQVQADFPLARATLMRIGGPARHFLEVDTPSDLGEALAWVRSRRLPHYLLGNGSNVVFADAGVAAAVVCIKASRPRYALEGRVLHVQAGTSWPSMAARMARQGLRGLEAGYGIPGTIGGALCMHAGIPQATIGERLRDVRVMSVASGREYLFTRAQMHFGDRTSRVLTDPDLAVVAARFDLEPDRAEVIVAEMKSAMAARRAAQPYEVPNAGCMFRRAPGVLPGQLIDNCGLKGLRVGGAEVSPRHANFIVNTGGATAADVAALAAEVARRVQQATGVVLTREIQFVDSAAPAAASA